MKVEQLTSLRALPFVILVAIIGYCILPSGCTAGNDDEDSESIIVVSNVFTPDGDEENDFFEVKTKDEDKEVSLKIYTRAGTLVFSDEAERCIWWGYSLDGQPMAAGIYHYMAEIVGSSPKISKSGFVHLYR